MNDLISLEQIAQWQKLKTLVLDSVSSPITKRVYNMALDEFMGRFDTLNNYLQNRLMATRPSTLQDAIVYFADPNNCFRFLSERQWRDGVVTCPSCGSEEVSFVASRRLWQCKTRHPKALFSVKVGTIFEDSVIGLDKWLATMWIVANCEYEVSSYRIHRALGITQKTAWFMLLRIRLAIQNDQTGGMTPGRHAAE